MSVKFKKDLRLKDYLELIAKQNDAIINQLMIDDNSMTSVFRKANYDIYKESIKGFTIIEKLDKVEKLETPKKLKDEGLKFGYKQKNDNSFTPVIIILIIMVIIVVLAANGVFD